MGVKKSMDTFFAGLSEQTTTGYGSRIVSTPMGPFKWNDQQQLWENVNNGMVMNNISFQDMFIMDYDTVGSGGEGRGFKNPTIGSDWGQLYDPAMTVEGQTYWASDTGPQTTMISGKVVTFTNVDANTLIALSISKTAGNLDTPYLRYAKNGGITTYTAPFAIAENDNLRVGVLVASFDLQYGDVSGEITVKVQNSGTVLDTITYEVINAEP